MVLPNLYLRLHFKVNRRNYNQYIYHMIKAIMLRITAQFEIGAFKCAYL